MSLITSSSLYQHKFHMLGFQTTVFWNFIKWEPSDHNTLRFTKLWQNIELTWKHLKSITNLCNFVKLEFIEYLKSSLIYCCFLVYKLLCSTLQHKTPVSKDSDKKVVSTWGQDDRLLKDLSQFKCKNKLCLEHVTKIVLIIVRNRDSMCSTLVRRA